MRAIDAEELAEFPYSESAGTEEQIEEWVQMCGFFNEEEEKAKKLCWKVIEGFVNVIKTAPTISQPGNGPFTQADLNKMYLNEVWLEYKDGSGEEALVVNGKIYSTSSLEGAGLDLEDYITGETLDAPTGTYKVHRRPPEGKGDT